MTAIKNVRSRRGVKKTGLLRYLSKYRYYYLMLLPAIVFYVVFHYVPMFGAQIAFKDFNIRLGILKSPWVGLENFTNLFKLPKFSQVVITTIRISFIRLIWGFPFPIIISLLLNELKSIPVKRGVQTVIYIPHFISWVILGGILQNLLSVERGAVNAIIKAVSGTAIPFLTSPKYFVGMLVVSMIWKTFGWNTIIYLAALAGVDPQLYEAAIIDGANRWKQMLHITLPSIMSTIVVVFILRVGSIMQAGFEQIFVLYHDAVYSVSDIIDTYVYRIGLTEGKYEMAAAVGLFKSVINFLLLITANTLSRAAGEGGIY